MSKATIRSLALGIFILFLISATTLIFLDAKSGIKISKNSKISAEKYFVGSDYSGLITKEFVKQGDIVQKGQQLLLIKSSAVLEDIKANKVDEKDLLYPLSEDRQIIIKASQNGRVNEINYSEGSFVPANNSIMNIIAAHKPFVITEYLLTKEDFVRLNEQTKLQVKLPNGLTVTSPITDITVDNSPSFISTKFRVIIKSDIEPDNNLLLGSPVTTHIYLNQQTLLQRLVNFIKKG